MHSFTSQDLSQRRSFYDRQNSGIHTNQPQLNAILTLPLRKLCEYFERGVLHVEDSASVHRDDFRLRFLDQRLNLVCELCRIGKENWTFRPQQQKARKTLILGMFRRLRPEYVSSGLAPQDIYWRIGYVVRQCDQGNDYGYDDSL